MLKVNIYEVAQEDIYIFIQILGWLAILKKNYKQILRLVFSCFAEQFFSYSFSKICMYIVAYTLDQTIFLNFFIFHFMSSFVTCDVVILESMILKTHV